MDVDMNTSIDPSLDSLETAFSDSTRKILRQINLEWQKVLKCRKDLAAKADELQAVKENINRLQKIKIQNENYLKSAGKRLEDLKISNAELKRQINKLEKEKVKVVKSCAEQEEYMRQKIAFYEEKWRKRYETIDLKEPKMREKVGKVTEMRKLDEKLRILIEEEKNCEKELLRVKSKRNMLVDESKLYPFQNFVVNIAKIYLETKKINIEYEKVSLEIADIENRIKSKYQIWKDKMLYSKNPSTVPQKTVTEQCVTEEITYLNQNDVEMLENENTEPELVKDASFNFIAQKDTSITCKKSFSNDMISTGENADHIPSYTTNEKIKPNSSEMKKDDYITKNAKVLSNEPKAKKWMERLKIFVPKFRTISEEKHTENDKNSTNPIVLENSKIEERSKGNLFPKNLNDLKAPIQRTTSSSLKKVTFDQMTFDARENASNQQAIFQNTSKYFQKTDDKIEQMDWNKDVTYRKTDAVKFVIQDNSKTKELEDKVNIDENITKIGKDMNQESLTFIEPMDTDDDEQPMDRKLEPVTENIKESKTDEVIVAEDIEMDESLLNTNRVRETKSSLEYNETREYSFTSNEKKTTNILQDTDMGNSLLETFRELENKISLGRNQTNMFSSLIKNKETINNYQGKSLNDTVFQKNHEEKTTPCSECNETRICSPVLNEKETITQNQNRNANPDEIQREVPDLQQIAKIPISVNPEPVFKNAATDISKQPYVHHLDNIPVNSPRTPTKSKGDPEKSNEHITPTKVKIPGENLKNIQVKALENSGNTNNKSPQTIPAEVIPHSFAESSSKNSQPDFKKPTDLTPKTPSTIDSNPKTPLTKQLQSSGEMTTAASTSNFDPLKDDSSSPGFAFTTRLMYATDVNSSKNAQAETLLKNPQSSIFAQMAFFNQNSPRNIVFTEAQSPDDEKSRFLSDFEDYLTDSPPVIKGTEKSMFAFADDSPENENKNDFFPLFAASNVDTEKDDGNNAAAFTLNFGGDSQVQSPGEIKGFKFLF